MRLLLACLLATACGVGLDNTGAGSGTPTADAGTGPVDAGTPTATQAAWLDPQNAVRAHPNPAPSSPLPPFTWSDSAAQVAQAWANNCVYQHNSPAGRGNRGENIAANTPVGSWTPSNVVAAWAGEVSDYNYASNTCASGKECGHYTQIVWASTTRVGCGMATCSTGSPFSGATQWDFWVCDYEPPGNFIGQKPY
jgi:pathogenesis-related protein 1